MLMAFRRAYPLAGFDALDASLVQSPMRADGKCPRSPRGAPIMVRSASDRLHKKSIFCTKSSPLVRFYVQSHRSARGHDDVRRERD
jgi:hypothetical protein